MAERNRNMAIACEVCGTADNVIMFYRRKNLCNRCKQFSRRITKATTPIVCNCTGECSPSGTCREGRLAKCAEIGLNIFDEKLEKLFKNLMDWNERRLFNFTNSQPTEDLSLEEIMNRGTIEFTERSPSDHNLTSHQWASLQNITTIEFMKGFHFVKFLNPEETTAFIKKTYFKTTIFFMAMASFQSNRDSMIFPGNKDVFPEESVDIQQRHDKLFKRIRCLLISKFIEFRVTKEEFLLLSVLISCDPNIIMEPNSDDGSTNPNLTTKGMNLIRTYYNFHQVVLMDYCRKNYKLNYWPNRLIGQTYWPNRPNRHFGFDRYHGRSRKDSFTFPIR